MKEAVLVSLMHPRAMVPQRSEEGSAGYDVRACEAATLEPWTRKWLCTGIAITVPPNTYGRIAGRSGLAGRGIDVAAGVIDPSYTGECKVLLCNNSNETHRVVPGDRIAQLLIERLADVQMVSVDALAKTKRGNRGFGSTGV